MVSEQSLQQIMDAAFMAIDAMPPACAAPILNDFDAFVTFDDILRDLHKQYLDAKEQRKRVGIEHGGGGMNDMAAMIEDSAWCAMQTRYMELRADRALMARAMQIVDDDRKQREEKQKQDDRDKYRAMMDYFFMVAQMRKEQKRADDALAFYAVCVLLNQTRVTESFFRSMAMPSHSFNRMAA